MTKGVTDKTRLDLILERSYIREVTLSICKICNGVYLSSFDCIEHQRQEHTDKQFEERF